MAEIRFFPTNWFLNANWTSVRMVGRLENFRSIFLQTNFRPYFTLRYSTINQILSNQSMLNQSLSSQSLSNQSLASQSMLNQEKVSNSKFIEYSHNFLINSCPVYSIQQILPQVYRVFLQNKFDYYSAADWCTQNLVGCQITDLDLDPLAKFFSLASISPGSWQRAVKLQAIHPNINPSIDKYSQCELEYYVQNIVSIPSTIFNNNPGTTSETESAFDKVPQVSTVFFEIIFENPTDIQFPSGINYSKEIRAILAIFDPGNSSKVSHKYYQKKNDSQNLELKKPVEVIHQFFETESQILTEFLTDLSENIPDYLISSGVDFNTFQYIGRRCSELEIPLPNISKLKSYHPFFDYFENTTDLKIEDGKSLLTPGISRIHLKDFYKHRHPYLKLSSYIDRIKSVHTQQKLFKSSEILSELSQMANFWGNSSEKVCSKSKDLLFRNWIQNCESGYQFEQKSLVFPSIRKSGVFRNVISCSLSNIYLELIRRHSANLPLTSKILDKFSSTMDGLIPFQSGYFPTNFDQLSLYLQSKLDSTKIVSCDPWEIRLTENSLKLPELSTYLLQIYTPQDCIEVDSNQNVYREGSGSLAKPFFPLIDKYLNLFMNQMLNSPTTPVDFSKIESVPDDFVLETKIGKDYKPILSNTTPEVYNALFEQLRQLKINLTSPWEKIYYIRTTNGPVIRQIYENNLSQYINILDMEWYNREIIQVLSIFDNT